MEEKVYRQLVDSVFARIDKAFEKVDPDLAESTLSQGTLIIVFREKLQLILSPQTPMRQIWAAFRDRAWHFSLASDGASDGDRWVDDRGQGIELLRLVEELALANAGVTVKIL
ncbi:MAG TPA: iron donor protein CyaY [Polyangia bacterium]